MDDLGVCAGAERDLRQFLVYLIHLTDKGTGVQKDQSIVTHYMEDRKQWLQLLIQVPSLMTSCLTFLILFVKCMLTRVHMKTIF